MFNFKIINKPTFKINRNIIRNISKFFDEIIIKKQLGNINLVFVSMQEIQKLNKIYRKKNYVTDVLSFHYFSDFTNLKNKDIAGEIIFCEEKIISQANLYGLGKEYEFYKLLIHSILHILGFDHETDEEYKNMQNLENKIWQNVIINYL